MFQILLAVRSILDYRTEGVNGIPGLTFNTDTNSNAGNRIQYPTWAPTVPISGWGGQGGTIDPGPEPAGGYHDDSFGDVVRKSGLLQVVCR
mmetsp:Transcript_4951/g.9845  ORF Transcript_4951/g.9845 Transcript_4951/m.9845 type:complete len:91 (-) Transcript_4951:839-1111(-)